MGMHNNTQKREVTKTSEQSWNETIWKGVIAERSEANKRVQCQPTYVYIYMWVSHVLGPRGQYGNELTNS